MKDGPGTPGFWGYLAAFAIGLAAFALISSLVGTPASDISAFEVLYVFLYLGVMLLGVPFLFVGLFVGFAMMGCRLCARQRDQVLIAALTSCLFGILLSPIVDGVAEKDALVLGLPLAMALGRAAVIPLAVERGRR